MPPREPNETARDAHVPRATHHSQDAAEAQSINNSGEKGMTEIKNKYMTPKEVAAALEVSPTSIVRWVRDGLIESKRFGERIIKIPRTELERLLNEPQVKELK